MKILFSSVIVATTLLVSACANKSMQTKESGFLNNYDNLQQQENLSQVKAYISPSADFSKYENIYVAPVEIISAIPKDEQTYKQKLLFTQMQDYLTSHYKEVIKDGTNYNLVDSPSYPRTVIFNSAISAVEVNQDDLGAMDVMPMILVVKMIKRSADNGNVRILGESKLSDASNGQMLVSMLELHKGKKVRVDAQELEFKDIQATLDDWIINNKNNIVRLRRGIIKYQGEKNKK